MSKVLNFTGRQEMPTGAIRLLSDVADGVVKLEGHIDLAHPLATSPGEVCLIIRVRNHFRRSFSLGPPSEHLSVDLALPDLGGDAEGIQAEVRVVDTASESKPILGISRRVRVTGRHEQGKEESQSLLGVRKGVSPHSPWNLNLENFGGEGPWLEISPGMDDFRVLARNHWFLTLVLPEVIRQIAHHLVLGEDPYSGDPSSEGSFEDKWMLFFLDLEGVHPLPPPSKSADREYWIDTVVDSFCSSRDSVATLNNLLNGD